MSNIESDKCIDEALASYRDNMSKATRSLESQLKQALSGREVVGGIGSFNAVRDAYLKEHQMDMGTLAMLSGVSPNTMTRLKKSLGASRVDTVSAVLDAMGMELVIARKGQSNG